MTLKEKILIQNGINLPNSGGNGLSPEEAIVILPEDSLMDVVSIEYQVIACTAKVKEWKQYEVTGQSLVFHGEKKLDKLTVAYLSSAENVNDIQKVDYYFDIISDFDSRDIISENEEEKMREMLRFVEEMERLTR